jgi:hypothetical protein
MVEGQVGSSRTSSFLEKVPKWPLLPFPISTVYGVEQAYDEAEVAVLLPIQKLQRKMLKMLATKSFVRPTATLPIPD